jgi:hypothetical protein
MFFFVWQKENMKATSHLLSRFFFNLLNADRDTDGVRYYPTYTHYVYNCGLPLTHRRGLPR